LGLTKKCTYKIEGAPCILKQYGIISWTKIQFFSVSAKKRAVIGKFFRSGKFLRQRDGIEKVKQGCQPAKSRL
jgi:hypothetical protein